MPVSFRCAWFPMIVRGACLLLIAAGAVTERMAWGDEPSAVAPIPPSPASTEATPAVVTPGSRPWQDRPLRSLKATIKPTEGELPTNLAAPRMAQTATIYSGYGENRPWMLSTYEWEAPATKHLPLLFEEPNLERLGYTHGFYWNKWGYESGPHAAECLQPVVSGMHFFGRIPFIPYMWGYQDPCEPVYTLGTDRPGSPVCYRKHLIPLDLNGALYQAGGIVGLVFLIP